MEEMKTEVIETEKYKAFVDKFKPKKTTDDCYTPPYIYDAVKDWAVKEYGLEGRPIVRPFYPGGDYENVEKVLIREQAEPGKLHTWELSEREKMIIENLGTVDESLPVSQEKPENLRREIKNRESENRSGNRAE